MQHLFSSAFLPSTSCFNNTTLSHLTLHLCTNELVSLTQHIQYSLTHTGGQDIYIYIHLQISFTPGHYLESWRDVELIRKRTGVLMKSRKVAEVCFVITHDPQCTCSQGYALISNQFWNDLPAREVNNLAAAFIDRGKNCLLCKKKCNSSKPH